MPKKRFNKKNGITIRIGSIIGAPNEQSDLSAAVEDALNQLDESQQEYQEEEEIEGDDIIEETFDDDEEPQYEVDPDTGKLTKVISSYDRQRFELGEYGFWDDGYDYMQHFRKIGGGVYWGKDDFLALQNQEKISREKEKMKKQLPILKEEREELEKEIKEAEERSKNAAEEKVPVVIQDDKDETRYKTYDGTALLDKDIVDLMNADEIPEEDQMEDDFVIKALMLGETDEERKEREAKEKMNENPINFYNLRHDNDHSELSKAFDEQLDEFNENEVLSSDDEDIRGKVSAMSIEDELYDDLLDMKLIKKKKRDERIDKFLAIDSSSESDLEEEDEDEDEEEAAKLKAEGLIKLKKKKKSTEEIERAPDGALTQQQANDVMRILTTTDPNQKVEQEVENKYEDEWDSTYSNTENHPSVIESQKRVKRILLNRTGLPVTQKDSKTQDKIAEKPAVNQGQARNKGETKEEKKLRKQAVKEEKKNKRMQKKEKKEVYKKEEIRIRKTVAGQLQQSQTTIHY